MGTINSVRCPRCGYEEETLLGVGGDVGMMGHLIVTAVCTKNARLVDTDTGEISDETYDLRNEPGLPTPGRCPEQNCRSRSHAAWDPASAVCPACGSPGCPVNMVGIWD